MPQRDQKPKLTDIDCADEGQQTFALATGLTTL
jgi:hypothetical protein